MEDWLGGITCLLLKTYLKEEEILNNLYVGIDVSKESASAQGLDATGRKSFYLKFKMDSDGFSELLETIMTHCKEKTKVMVAMESTACYHVNLFSFLISKGINAIIINPLLISNFSKLALRKTKTDKKDALVIAQFLLTQKDSLAQHAISSEMADLRDIARQRESLVDQMTAIKHEIKQLLTMTFPELEGIVGLFTKSMLRLLCKHPSAAAIESTSHCDIAEILIPGSMGRNTTDTVKAIKQAAGRSVGTTRAAREMIIKQKASILVHLDEHLQQITSVLIEHCQSIMQEDIEVLRSIKGIGDKTAINFLVEMGGDITLFANHKKLIATAGLDPSVCQSGKYEGISKISKRGNRHLRRVIWLMATKVIIFNDFFKSYFTKRKKEGLPYKKAVLATAHKLIRIIFAMLSNKTLFTANASS